MRISILLVLLGIFGFPREGRSGFVKFIHQYGSPVVQFNASYHFPEVPLHVRDVPGHPGDAYLGGLDSIPVRNEKIGLASFSLIGLSYAAGLSVGGLRLLTGPTIAIWDRFGDVRVQQNQFGTSERGDPFSLRYYQLSWVIKRPTVKLGTRLTTPSLSIGENKWIRLGVGAEFDPLGTPLEIEAGWDRFNRDQVWRKFSLGEIHEDAVFVRLEYHTFPPEDKKLPWRYKELKWEERASLYVEIGRTRASFHPGSDFETIRTDIKGTQRIVIGGVWDL